MTQFKPQFKGKIENFVDQHAKYYVDVFQDMEFKGSKLSFNIPVLFVGSLWFFYRRMYVLGSLLFITPIILLVCLLLLFKSHSFFSEYDSVIVFGVLVAIRLFITGIANYMYWKKFLAYQDGLRSQNNKNVVVGTNSFAPIVACIVFFLLFCWLLSGMMQGMRHT